MNEKNTVIIAILLIVGMSLFNSFSDFTGNYVSAPQKCEPLNGASYGNIYEKQTIKYWSDPASGIPPKIMTSTCATRKSVSVVACREDANPITYVVQCNTGEICEDGRCVKGEIADKTGNCVDSDGGANSLVKGTTTIIDGRGRGLDEVSVDYCATSVTVTENACSPSGNGIEKKILRCPYPETSNCVDGRCVK